MLVLIFPPKQPNQQYRSQSFNEHPNPNTLHPYPNPLKPQNTPNKIIPSLMRLTPLDIDLFKIVLNFLLNLILVLQDVLQLVVVLYGLGCFKHF